MTDHIKQFYNKEELLSMYDPGDKDLAYWDGPGWYYMTPDHHWHGSFYCKEDVLVQIELDK